MKLKLGDIEWRCSEMFEIRFYEETDKNNIQRVAYGLSDPKFEITFQKIFLQTQVTHRTFLDDVMSLPWITEQSPILFAYFATSTNGDLNYL